MMPLPRRHNVFPASPRGSSGMTILETVVAISIFGIILVSVAAFQSDVFSLNRTLGIGLSAQGEARQTLKRISAELRSTTESSGGAYPISAATGTSVTFYADSNDDGLRERYRYFLSGTEFRKGVLVPAGNPPVYTDANEQIAVVVHNVQNGATPIFAYYNSAYDGTTPSLPSPVSVTQIRLVKLTLVIDQDTNKAPGPVTLTTQVSLRNLKDNL
jgi:hypothetical protein